MRNKLLIGTFFLLPIIHWEGFYSQGNTARWVLLSLALPVVWMLSPPPATLSCCGWLERYSRAHRWLGAFFIWATISALWAVSPYEAAYRMWHFSILAVAFWIGATLDRAVFRRCVTAFAVALIPVSLLALLDYDALGKLFDNPNQIAEAAALAVVGVIMLRPWLAALLLNAVVVPLSKGVFVALLLALAACVPAGWRGLLVPVGVGIVLFLALALPSTAFAPRVALYVNSLSMVSLAGRGVGSFWAEYPAHADDWIESPPSVITMKMRPHTAHNDGLTLAVETGVIGLFLALGFIVHVVNRRCRYVEERAAKAIVWVFLGVGLFSFPLYAPATGALFTLAAGFLVRDSDPYRPLSFCRRKRVHASATHTAARQPQRRVARAGQSL